MTTVPVFTSSALSGQACSLQKIVSDLLSSFSTIAFQNKNIFVNNIPDNLPVEVSPQIIASILGGILTAVTNRSKGSLLVVSANTFDDIVLVEVKNYTNLNGHTLDKRLQQIQSLAEKIGGSVSVTGRRQDITTITFSFQNF